MKVTQCVPNWCVPRQTFMIECQTVFSKKAFSYFPPSSPVEPHPSHDQVKITEAFNSCGRLEDPQEPGTGQNRIILLCLLMSACASVHVVLVCFCNAPSLSLSIFN